MHMHLAMLMSMSLHVGCLASLPYLTAPFYYYPAENDQSWQRILYPASAEELVERVAVLLAVAVQLLQASSLDESAQGYDD